MSTLETVNDSQTGQHTPAAAVRADAATELCPWCRQPVSRTEYDRIRERIEGQERARIAKVEQTLKDRFAREKERAETAKTAEIEKARKDAAEAAVEQINALKASQDAVINQRLETEREAFERAKTEAEHAGPVLPGVDQSPALRAVEVEPAQDREAVRMGARRLDGEFVRIQPEAGRSGTEI